MVANTLYPRRAKVSAAARPKPVLAPVIKTTVSFGMMQTSLLGADGRSFGFLLPVAVPVRHGEMQNPTGAESTPDDAMPQRRV
jgi:hypothetical protein